MRAQGLSASIDSEAPRSDLSPTSGDGTVAVVHESPISRRAAGPRLLARLYPVCLAVADGGAMALAAAATQVPAGRPAVVAAVAVVGLNAVGGLYRVRRSPSLLADLRPMGVRALVIGALVAAPLPGVWWFTMAWICVVYCVLSLSARGFAHAAM